MNPALREVHSQVLQNVAVRIDLAFKAFFRRVKAGDKPGYPRFRAANRYDSFTYPQSGFRVESGRVFLFLDAAIVGSCLSRRGCTTARIVVCLWIGTRTPRRTY
jgi:transposase